MSLAEKWFGSPYLGEAEQPQEQRYPFLSVCVVFSCTRPNDGMAASVRDFERAHPEVDACDGTRGPHGHRKSLHWKMALGENPLLHRVLRRTGVSIASGF